MSEVHVSRFAALGTTAVVCARSHDAVTVAEAVLRREVQAIDAACSRFRNDAELTRVNRSAGRWVEVSPLLLEAVEVALRAAHQTDGACDPTLGVTLRELGYDRDFAEIDGDGPALRASVRLSPSWPHIEVDHIGRRVRIPPGVELDLGATAKALASDRAADRAAAATASGVLVGLGGDLALAGEAPDEGWAVRVSDDHNGSQGSSDTTIRLAVGGLATSSVTVRKWKRGGEPVHHIIDPATGRPTQGPWRTVSVAAATCVDANTASTAAFVLGARARSWLEGQRLPARLVGADGQVEVVAGWPEAGE